MSQTNFHPKVSIVIPVYNGSNYVREAIDSALAQTYDNVEVIVVNDGSNDEGKTDEICRSYGDKIRYFKKENGGVATALNKGIEEMKGEYFSWLSHDDVYYPNKIEEQIKYLSKLGKDLWENTIMYSNYELIDGNSELISIRKFETEHKLGRLNSPFYPLLNGLIHGCSLLIPLKAFEKIGEFDPKLRTTQDYALWFSMFPKYSVRFLDKVLIKSRFHADQGSKKINVAQTEAEDLWLYFIKKLKKTDKIFIGGSEISFYQNTLKIVKDAGYLRVVEYLEDILEKQSKRKIESIKVSVVIPFYNREELVIESIKSVLKQTHKNYEIILVDDSSDENIGKLLRFVKTKKSIKLVGNKYKKGVSGARNTGIEMASGEYIAFLDSDDLFVPEKISRQLEFMIINNYVFSSTYYTTFGNHRSFKEVVNINDLVYPEIIAMCNIATPTVMVHRDIFEDREIRFQEDFQIGEDICLWIDIARVSPCYICREVLTEVRIHGQNAAFHISKQIEGLENIFSYVRKKHLSEKTLAIILRLVLSYHEISPKIISKTFSEAENKMLEERKLEFNSNMLKFLMTSADTCNLQDISRLVTRNLQISSHDLLGNKFNGHDLHLYLREKNIFSKQIVLHKETEDPNTATFDFTSKNATKHFLMQKDFFGTDVVHLHLVHNILDLNYLPLMTRLKPTVITLHDPFFLSGHCVHHFDCEKWQTHCQDCPYLDVPFAIPADYTSLNFELKKQAIQNSQITAIVASKWMEEKVKKSPIWKDKKVYLLPFGINQDLFKPGDIKKVREELEIDKDSIVLMFRADVDVFKGLDIIKKALKKIKIKKKIILITVDGKGVLDEFKDQYDIREYGWVKDDNFLVKLYQACDIFLMPSRQETFGMMAIEAMSCGKMVLSVNSLGSALKDTINSPKAGLSVDENQYTKELQRLLNKPKGMKERGEKSYEFAKQTYAKEKYVENMINIYKDVMANHKTDTEAELILTQLKGYLRNGIPMENVHKVQSNRKLNEYWKEESISRKLYRRVLPVGIRKGISKLFVKTLNIAKGVVPKNIKNKILGRKS